MVERGNFALALGLGGPDPELDQGAGLGRAVELVVDLDAVLVVDALQARQVVVADRVPVAEEKADATSFSAGTSRPAWMMVAVPAPKLGVEAGGELVQLGVAEPDQAGLCLRPLGLLARLGGRRRRQERPRPARRLGRAPRPSPWRGSDRSCSGALAGAVRLGGLGRSAGTSTPAAARGS